MLINNDKINISMNEFVDNAVALSAVSSILHAKQKKIRIENYYEFIAGT